MTAEPPRGTYKALLWDYDYLLDQSDDECCYSLSDREVQIILAQVDYIGWKTRYKPTETDIDQTIINRWMGNLTRKLMSGCCPDDGRLERFLPDGTFQTSDDGGETWVDNPDADPRNRAVQNPPLPGDASDSKRCAAADNVETLFTSYRDNLNAMLDASPTLVSIIAGILAFLAVITGVSGAAIGISVLLMGIASFMLTLSSGGVTALITSTVLDDFRCLVFCRMDNDGQLTYEAWQGLLADIADKFSDFPELFFYQTVNAMGYIGVNNAGSTGVASADDCDDCDCNAEWCYQFDFLTDDGDWEIRGGAPYGTWVSGQGWVGTTAGTGVAVVASRTLSAFTITHIDYDVVAAGTLNSVIIIDNTVAVASETNVASGHYSWNGSVSGTDITINPSSGASQGADCAITHIRFSGTGDNPFGTDNC